MSFEQGCVSGFFLTKPQRIMKAKNTVGFRLKGDACDPNEMANQLRPDNTLSREWIPQTLGDQVWVLYEFSNQSDKSDYILWVVESGIKSYGNYPGDKETEYFAKDMFMHNEDQFSDIVDHYVNGIKKF